MASNLHPASESGTGEQSPTVPSEAPIAPTELTKHQLPSSNQAATRPSSFLKSAVVKAASLGQSIGGTLSKTGNAVVKTSGTVGSAIGQTAAQTGKAIVEFAGNVGNITFKRSHRLVEQATEGTGQAVTYVGDNPLIRKLTGAFKLDWLIGASDRVDLSKAEAAVKKLQQEHPNESPNQIAHRIMLEKVIYAGGVGLATSLVPGEAIALLAVDFATTATLQTEMLYQIAAAYGLDLKDPARRGEVLAIFGLALGGSRAIKAGLVLVRNVPLAGAVIGASSNATILYAIGYAACRFYEAKLNPAVAEASTETLEAIQQKSESYLEVALAQQALVEQILAHMILASYPEKSWEDILPNLAALNLTPNSLETIGEHLKAPQPIGALLQQLNRDFAVLTLARCYTIAQLDGTTSPEEAKVLEAISEKFGIGLDAIKAIVKG